ncbi:MAG: hypothetical protein LQ346_005265 [Caloplaca aetnensis]|nr:MAG: hypothetical protein LQ346_005265 [Caloplaca aetnensis]
MSAVPVVSGEEPIERYDFALLTPVNREAVANFAKVSDALRSQASDHKHHAFFCRLDLPAGSIHTDSEHSFHSDTTPEAASDNDAEDNERAGYVLSLIPTHLPLETKLGWMMGAGRWDKDLVNGKVELLLAAEDDIHPQQLHFRFDKFGRLKVHGKHGKVEVDGESVAGSSPRVLSHSNFIKIGPLSYRFVHILPRAEESAFQRAKNGLLLEQMGIKEVPNELTSATPSANDIKIGDWDIRGTVGVSATTVVEAASNLRTGEVVAVKRLRRLNQADAQRIEKEVAIYEALKAVKNHEYGRFVMRMRFVKYKTQEEWCESADEVFILWTPLGRGTFQEFSASGKWSTTARDERLFLFYQVCLGVQAVHALGWMHRDIKPRNLYVVSHSPPRAVVGDFGSAVKINKSGHIPEPGHHGTIGWLAPELENPGFAAKYTQAVDVWSLGAIAYFLIIGGRLPWVSKLGHNTFLHDDDPARKDYRVMMSNLSKSKPGTIVDLIHQMLDAWPEERVDLRGVLNSHVMKATRLSLEASSEQNASTGSKRSAT